MTETEARALLLVRAFDGPAAAELAAEPARAPRAAERLAAREPAAAAALRAASWPRGLGAALAAIAFLAGIALDRLGSSGRIHLLSAPLGLLAWNLAVYVLLAVHALRALARHDAGIARDGWLREALGHALGRLAAARAGARAAAAVRFLADWARAGAPLHRERVARLLHAGAASLAAGLLASLYLRGLFFEFRAGWDSTFLSPEAVHRLLSIVLWPALQLTGDTLPSPEALARLRFSEGGGENAARWIHWIALTVALLVVLPRALLAAAAGRRAARLARALPGVDGARPAAVPAPPGAGGATTPPATPRRVRVLPYSYHPPPDAEAALRAALARRLGAAVALHLEAPLPLGAEERPEAWRPAATWPGPQGRPAVREEARAAARDEGAIPPKGDARPGADAAAVLTVPLFALTATPERETHGAFLAALLGAGGAAAPRAVLIDESGFRRRFPGPEGASRLAQRRAAWQRLVDAADGIAWFEDLAVPAGGPGDAPAPPEPAADGSGAGEARAAGAAPREPRP